ncbi:integrase [Pseudarthrobacter sp. PvP004]|uniref:tyrosine-type recombinase/integrase n=1 Tax=Pseudarthrobacter sp. PvP004 TaxID=2817850 RepID=UPI001AE9BA5C|nr:tyrosine-type recombinase/integrase [Pseudarthrobacter sp. PvP004]MBP2266200.1 integrase [Pseudarthrobacter sp. PvP004]MBP2267813.1 integrase [Pseudarthrobacter sp. PvP004]MBP2269301.1 integrase [Pseudarthrobacter sp. PvP004]
MGVDGSGRVHLVESLPLLHPEQQTFEEMLSGWRNQQLSRNLQFGTIDQRIRFVQRFMEHVNEFPWRWSPAHVEEYFGDLRSIRKLAHSTLRGQQSALRQFNSYVANPDYGWDVVCERRFGTHPAQVFFDWNTATHAEEFEGRPSKRPFTKDELQRLFDYADDQVEIIQASGRKGWKAAYRDSVMLKIAYSYGLRFNELRHLQTVDFSINPHIRRFRKVGVCKVRFGKARKGSPPKSRSVLTVFEWTPDILEDWLANGRGTLQTLDLFPSERGGLIVESTLLRRLRRYLDELGIASDGLDLHSLRRSYATHLAEDGWHSRFVQDQMGHEYASTTGIYQFVSDDFRIRTLQAALDRTVADALEAGR